MHTVDGTAAMGRAVMGFHMNPLLALLVVVGLIFITPWCLAKLKARLPRVMAQNGETARYLTVLDALSLGPKRRLFSISVRGEKGQSKTALILTGGPSDLFLGWLPQTQIPLDTAANIPHQAEMMAQQAEGQSMCEQVLDLSSVQSERGREQKGP